MTFRVSGCMEIKPEEGAVVQGLRAVANNWTVTDQIRGPLFTALLEKLAIGRKPLLQELVILLLPAYEVSLISPEIPRTCIGVMRWSSTGRWWRCDAIIGSCNKYRLTVWYSSFISSDSGATGMPLLRIPHVILLFLSQSKELLVESKLLLTSSDESMLLFV